MNSFSYEKIETFFSNFSIICLFFAMIAYWIDLSGTFTRTRKNVLTLQTLSNLNFSSNNTTTDLSFVKKTNDPSSMQASSNMLELSTKKPFRPTISDISIASSNFGSLGICLANLSLFGLLALRWFNSGHFHLSNLYESLMFVTWALTFFQLMLGRMTPEAIIWLGSITSPTALLTNAFANFSLPSEMQRASALVPALKSNWLMMHVPIMISSYGALVFCSLLSIGFLILTSSLSSKEYDQQLTKESSSDDQGSKIMWARDLDNLSYRMLGIGFPLLTIGILSGAVWADEAWGSYWSWDPKETWALLTWLVFAIYLHTRITKNWQGKKPAIIASIGFVMVGICYLGVNLLGEGLHSYGWLKFFFFFFNFIHFFYFSPSRFRI
uniref:Cytochrome c biogenesis protein CcsA n=1 Tax=Raphidocelis subcapitata TaxID=307507 RepID=A0A2Z6FBP2_9CHLO|nr:Cytochrome c biogenesis protein CcsA [Raphidocelis subcapitata]